MSLYLYAVAAGAPRGGPGRGLGGERLRVVRAGPLVGVAGALAAAPPLTARALAGHDAVIRRLAARLPALLPARFGLLFRDADALADRLAAAAPLLVEALGLVAGREQMTLRVYGRPAARSATRLGRAAGRRAGTRYLSRRLAAEQRAAGVPEIEPLRPALRPFVLAERVERHATPPLVASVYHLVARGQGRRYLAALDRAAPAPVQVRASGPWPVYAFAPQVLA